MGIGRPCGMDMAVGYPGPALNVCRGEGTFLPPAQTIDRRAAQTTGRLRGQTTGRPRVQMIDRRQGQTIFHLQAQTIRIRQGQTNSGHSSAMPAPTIRRTTPL